jgi:hypothetical protein
MDQAPTMGRLMIAGVVGGVIGGVVSFVLWLIAGAIGMPTEVNVQGQGITSLAWFQFVAFATFAGLGGGIVAGLLRNRVNAFRTFNIIAIVVLVVSMIPPLAQPAEVAWSTRIILMVTHVIVYITVVKSIQREMAPGS